MDRDYEEYRLKSTTAANITHNLMVLQSQTANFQDFTPPVRLIRDQQYDSDDEDEDGDVNMGRPKKPEPVAAGRGKKKRTRILYLEDEDEIALREQESVPWLLEDFDGQHAFHGKLEGGQHGNYVFFVNQGNEFRVLPISRWYRFQPKLAFQPLTIEEAEERMGKKGHSGTASRASSQDNEEEKKPVKKLEKLLAAPLKKPMPPGLKKKFSRSDEDHEDIDFEDIFDDDDEGIEDSFDDITNADTREQQQRDRKAKASGTTLQGKQMKKLLKNLGEGAEDEDDEEEDELDPYADEEDLEEIADLVSRSTVPLVPQPQQKVFQPIPNKPQTSSSQEPAAKPVSRTMSPSLAPGQSTLITEQDIVGILRGQSMGTKDLIARLKPKLKADPANKDVLRDLIKRMATMRTSGNGDEEKLLELKPEYR